ncbi:hypothetical protein NDU88_002376 [Pleurodeles waltl]|uniref:Uncharacterized protein n=1 Tax=Pleurodeles waltl TaxID=8319 RepID=A0AAV7UVE8_PLEWA|nr:hypothetical protein NDU88_002376 [Pleurodeles waltl]
MMRYAVLYKAQTTRISCHSNIKEQPHEEQSQFFIVLDPSRHMLRTILAGARIWRISAMRHDMCSSSRPEFPWVEALLCHWPCTAAARGRGR